MFDREAVGDGRIRVVAVVALLGAGHVAAQVAHERVCLVQCAGQVLDFDVKCSFAHDEGAIGDGNLIRAASAALIAAACGLVALTFEQARWSRLRRGRAGGAGTAD